MYWLYRGLTIFLRFVCMYITDDILYYTHFAKDHFFYSVLLLCIFNKYEKWRN